MESNDSPFQCGNIDCSYYDPAEFNKLTASFRDSTSFLHLNCRGLSANWASFRDLLCDLHSDQFSFDLIGISEVFRCDNDTRLALPGYHDLIARCRDDGSRGGVGLFIKDVVNFKIRDDISVFIPHVFESLFVELKTKSKKNTIVGVIYRPNTAPTRVTRTSATLIDHFYTNDIASSTSSGIIINDVADHFATFYTIKYGHPISSKT